MGARVRMGRTRPLRTARSRLVQGLGAHTDTALLTKFTKGRATRPFGGLDYNKAQLQVLASVECVSGAHPRLLSAPKR